MVIENWTGDNIEVVVIGGSRDRSCMAIVLITTDGPEFHSGVYEALNSRHVVLKARGGQEGLFMFYLHNPDIVITSLQNQAMTSVEFIQSLRSLPNKAKIIGVSSLTSE